MPRLRRINVVFLYVADLARARAFYESVVGFGPPVVQTPTWAEYALEEGSTHFALYQGSPEWLAGQPHAAGAMRFSIVVDDVTAAYEELRARGVEFTRPPEQGAGFTLAEFLDPEGNAVRLLQYTTAAR